MEAAVDPRARPVRVLVADDEPLFVDMVMALLAREERIDVVGAARDGREAVDLAISLAPEVIVMDISMPLLDGIEAARRIREVRSDASILILTGSSMSAEIDRSRQVGVAAFLTKDRIATQLVDAILDLGPSS
ncbi:MAG TPA: response regulator transcription factor [Gaiellaceae bacterium]|jgi:DNA-binding NarL/FixJ family response regulator|nr:response regulator transcription factor [Gaiellaceae bacterium]